MGHGTTQPVGESGVASRSPGVSFVLFLFLCFPLFPPGSLSTSFRILVSQGALSRPERVWGSPSDDPIVGHRPGRWWTCPDRILGPSGVLEVDLVSTTSQLRGFVSGPYTYFLRLVACGSDSRRGRPDCVWTLRPGRTDRFNRCPSRALGTPGNWSAGGDSGDQHSVPFDLWVSGGR